MMSPTAHGPFPSQSVEDIATQPNSMIGPTAHRVFPSQSVLDYASEPNSTTGPTAHGPFPSQSIPDLASELNSTIGPTAHGPFPSQSIPDFASEPNSTMGPTAHGPFPSQSIPDFASEPNSTIGPTAHRVFPSQSILDYASEPNSTTGPTAHGPFPSQSIPDFASEPNSMMRPTAPQPKQSRRSSLGGNHYYYNDEKRRWVEPQRNSMMAPTETGPMQTGPAATPQPNSMMDPTAPHTGAQVGTLKSELPRPVHSSPSLFETRQGSDVSPPPPATSDFVVRDTGNCSPRLMRCTVNQIPCSGEILAQSCMPLTLMVQPFALPHPLEEPIQLVDFGEIGLVKCTRCEAYINPFMRFIDQGRHFVCNLCGFSNDTPKEYICDLGPDMRRLDADERLELCRGTVEFVATKEFMVRELRSAVYFFLVDVSMNAIGTGAAAAACSAISQAISDIPESPRAMVGIATFDSAIHFYNLKCSQQQPMMLNVPDVEDGHTTLQTDLIVPLGESREALEQLLESIPSMYQANNIAESAFGAAIKAGFLALKPTGGKLLIFESVFPSVGIGSLSSREAEGRINVSAGEKGPAKLLQPADKTLKSMAVEFAKYQVCVDIFLTTQTYVDIASISVVPRTTGGQIYYYYPFSAVSDPPKLYNDLYWNLNRPQGFEAFMHVRCSQGLQVQEYSGNFHKSAPTYIDLPAIDSDKTIMVTFKHDDKFHEGAECGFQCAVIYTTVHGQRRIRVMNLSLPCTSVLGDLFWSADLDSQFSYFLKQVANGILTTPLTQVVEQILNHITDILGSYRKFCSSISSPGQLILPEALKLLPLYTLALFKSCIRTDGWLDDRSYWASHVASISTSLAVPLVYPRLISIHDLTSKQEEDSILPGTLALSSEYLSNEGVFLLENGEDALIYVGGMVNPEILQRLFGAPSLEHLPSQLVLQQFNNDLSKKLNEVINEIGSQRCSYPRLRLCKKDEPSEMLFRSYMVEDRSPESMSYVEFVILLHKLIRCKLNQTE